MLNILTRSRDGIFGALKETEVRRVQTSRSVAMKLGTLAMVLMLTLFARQTVAQSPQGANIRFVNVADSTQGLSDFSQFPAINNRGAVAFVATQNGTEQDVFKWERRELRTIASTTGSPFTFFSDNVVINAAGIVGFQASLGTVGRASGIFISDGLATKTIVNSTEQALPGFGIGPPSINASGTVAFGAFRNGFRSSIIFTGNGGALTPMFDSLNTEFGSFGAVAINARGEVVFRGIRKDRSDGIFVAIPSRNETGASGGISAGVSLVDIADANNFGLSGFGDPVINDAGVVADSGGGGQGLEIFSGNARGVTARTDATSGFFADFEHPSINNHGAVAFSTFEANGAQGIFVELTGGASPIAVLQTGDPLFGSTVTAVSVGRFAFNDHFRLAFEYELADGRSGIAVASLQVDEEGQGDGPEETDGGK
ncbi:MAG TPA: choice-of-anchor tandem repeat NxxGxxAF-containing protein [Candidatus Angelobacter sp.]